MREWCLNQRCLIREKALYHEVVFLLLVYLYIGNPGRQQLPLGKVDDDLRVIQIVRVSLLDEGQICQEGAQVGQFGGWRLGYSFAQYLEVVVGGSDSQEFAESFLFIIWGREGRLSLVL